MVPELLLLIILISQKLQFFSVVDAAYVAHPGCYHRKYRYVKMDGDGRKDVEIKGII